MKNWIFERYVLGELSQEYMAEVDIHLQNHPKSREGITRLNDSNEKILSQYPPSEIIPKILSRYQREKSEQTKPTFFKRFLYLSPLLASALFILLVLLPRQGDEMRIKGSQEIDLTQTNLMIHRQSGESIELLENGERARAGDLLQIAYTAGKAAYGVIISIDGEGTVTLHYPYTENDSTQLEKDKKILLNNAYELDQAQGFERFFFITAAKEIEVQTVIETAENLARVPSQARTEKLKLPPAFQQTSILLVK